MNSHGACPTCEAKPGAPCRTKSGARCKPHMPRLGKTRKTVAERFWRDVAKAGADECWLWTGRQYVTGYGMFQLNRKPKRAHRLSWEMANGREIPAGLFILHSCDTPLCVNPKHLRPGTHEENMRDMSVRARTVGEKCSSSKLTAEQVRSIKAARAGGATQASIARAYGVHQSTISLIVNERRWERALGGDAA